MYNFGDWAVSFKDIAIFTLTEISFSWDRSKLRYNSDQTLKSLFKRGYMESNRSIILKNQKVYKENEILFTKSPLRKMSLPPAKISNLDQRVVKSAANNICMRSRAITNVIFWLKTTFIDLIQNQNRL